MPATGIFSKEQEIVTILTAEQVTKFRQLTGTHHPPGRMSPQDAGYAHHLHEARGANSFAGPDCEVWDFPLLDEGFYRFPPIKAPGLPESLALLRLFVGKGTAEANGVATVLRTTLAGILTPA